jgi:hypothetical protein
VLAILEVTKKLNQLKSLSKHPTAI